MNTLSPETVAVIASSDYGHASYITCEQIISGSYYKKDKGWSPIPEDARDEMFDFFRDFVAASARGNRRERISYCPMSRVPSWGILGRLWVYPSGKVEYVAGQDYNSEMGTLRDAFDR